jgi:cobalt-zinc-cadmium efflux system protein
MGLGHDHSHHHSTPKSGKDFQFSFLIGIGLNIAFVFIEAIYGLIANSMALVADAGHNLSDVLGLVFAWLAVWLSGKQATSRFTYGYRRTSILAALVNAVVLLLVCGGIAWEAIRRFQTLEEVSSDILIGVAAVGIIINGATALLFYRGQEKDANIRGVFLGMAADALISLGVVIAGVIMKYTKIYWIDPVISIVIVSVIIIATWGLLVDALKMSLDAVPKGIDIGEVKKYLEGLEGVNSVHDIHIWPISTTETAMTAHLVVKDLDTNEFLHETSHELEKKFEIVHTTLQLESSHSTIVCHLDCVK